MNTTSATHALYVRSTRRGRWKLDSLHPTHELAMTAALSVRAVHVWVTTVPAPTPKPDPTRDPLEPLGRRAGE